MLIIPHWFGRLGNNIIQVQNAIHIALYHHHDKIQIPSHSFFNKTLIHFSVKTNSLDNIQDIFYYRDRIKNIDMNCFEKNHEKVKEILGNLFVMKKDIQEQGDNDIIIHLRSGDIFTNHPHQSYIVPPLSFFVSILEKWTTKENIIVLAEDDRNPILRELQKRYPQLQWKKQSLEMDIGILLGAKNVVESFGTFSISLFLFSQNIKKIYRPSYQISLEKEYFPNVEIEVVDLEEYRKLMFPWKNTKEQKKIMLEYK